MTEHLITTFFAKNFKPNYCQYADEVSSLTLRNYVYTKYNYENEASDLNIVFYNCSPEIIYNLLDENIQFLNEFNFSSIEIFGALTTTHCPDEWMVCSTHSIYGDITVAVTIEYKSSSDISHGSQVYIIRLNTVKDKNFSFHQLIQSVGKKDRHKKWKTRLDTETTSNFEIVELYDKQDDVLCLEEEIFCKPRFGNGRIELTGLCCPDFYLETLL
jgi:hypothetical protein